MLIKLVFLLLVCLLQGGGVLSQEPRRKENGPSTHTLQGSPSSRGDVQKFDMNQVAITKSKYSRV